MTQEMGGAMEVVGVCNKLVITITIVVAYVSSLVEANFKCSTDNNATCRTLTDFTQTAQP